MGYYSTVDITIRIQDLVDWFYHLLFFTYFVFNNQFKKKRKKRGRTIYETKLIAQNLFTLTFFYRMELRLVFPFPLGFRSSYLQTRTFPSGESLSGVHCIGVPLLYSLPIYEYQEFHWPLIVNSRFFTCLFLEEITFLQPIALIVVLIYLCVRFLFPFRSLQDYVLTLAHSRLPSSPLSFRRVLTILLHLFIQ